MYQVNKIKIVNGKIITSKKNFHITKWFENIIIVLIILNSLALVLDSPLNDPESKLSIALKYIDIIFTIIFAIEALLKIIAMGFFWNNLPGIEAYIMNGWNILDFIIVCASLADLGVTFSTSTADTSSLKSLKSLRAIRAVRPLRMISRNEGLQIVINTLFSSIPALKNVMMVTILLLLIFAIMGVNFFKGSFYQCEFDDLISDAQKEYLMNLISTKSDCLQQGGEWVNPRSNFDNVFESFLTLFEMMSTEGWTIPMYAGMDARGINNQPKVNSQPYY